MVGLHFDATIDQLTLCGTVVGINFQQLSKILFSKVVVLLTKVRLASTEQAFLVFSIQLESFVAIFLCLDEVLRLQVTHGQIQVACKQGFLSALLQAVIEIVNV